MKLASFATLASLAVCAFAQSIKIGYPYHNKKIMPGQHLRVQVNRPDSLTGSQEVAIVISLFECPNDGICPPPDVLGTTLYIGPYNPQFPKTSTPDQAPQQNFTVKVPSDLTANRKAQLSVTHMFLLGGGPVALNNEVKNVTLKVVEDA